MCGIAGGWWSDSKDVYSRLSKALKKMSDRGPDDSGCEIYSLENSVIGFGHSRLSIIDLSSAGHQPMYSRGGKFVIIFNGEIYNYLELRSDLIAIGYDFHTNSDTEVLLTAWIEWGESCLTRLMGMFSFAIYNRENSTLTCVRDAFGIKPLFYTITDNEFLFASELPAILELTSTAPSLNLQRAYDYLVYGDYDTKSETFINGIGQLEPGHSITYNLSNKTLKNPVKWWSPSVEQTSTLNFNQAAEELRAKFLQSVRYHLRSDVPLGTALSGGIDSSAVVCAIRHIEPNVPIHTFSFLAKGSPVSEEMWVNLVNQHVGAISHKVHVTSDELAKDLDDMILAQGEPFGSTSIYAQYRVFQLAKANGVKVTLDGQGADELLAGYRGYPGKRIRSLLEGGNILGALKFLGNWSKWPDRPLSIGIKAALAEFTTGEVYQILRELNGEQSSPNWLNLEFLRDSGVKIGYPRIEIQEYPKGRRLMAELNLSSSRNGLPGLLRHADRNSMRFSVESRVPFLTTDLASFLFSLPENYLISDKGETKSIFRAAMRGIVPDVILDRRDKIGFATPEQDWLIQLAPQARKWIEDAEPLSWINKKEMLNEFDSIIAGRTKFTWQAWRFINFSRWYKLIFEPISKKSPA